jgi:hypothetical protein
VCDGSNQQDKIPKLQPFKTAARAGCTSRQIFTLNQALPLAFSAADDFCEQP